MDGETFKMVDGILACGKDCDGRANAEALLEIGVNKGNLQEYSQVIATRYCLRPEAVLEWYAETLTRRIQEAKSYKRRYKMRAIGQELISEKLSRILKGDDGS